MLNQVNQDDSFSHEMIKPLPALSFLSVVPSVHNDTSPNLSNGNSGGSKSNSGSSKQNISS